MSQSDYTKKRRGREVRNGGRGGDGGALLDIWLDKRNGHGFLVISKREREREREPGEEVLPVRREKLRWPWKRSGEVNRCELTSEDSEIRMRFDSVVWKCVRLLYE